MDRMIFLAMNAAKQNLRAQNIAMNNLANTSTTGFKADFQAARAMPVFGDGHPSRVYSMVERPGIDFTHGAMVTTGNDMDIAVDGEGWIAVQAADGTEAYTRSGDLELTANGILQTRSGHPVIGNGGLITLPQNQAMVIGVDGTISIRPLGQEANTLAQVERVRLVNPPKDMLIKGEDGLFRMRDGAQADTDAFVRVKQGALEASNVNAVEQLTQIITLARQYEMSIKAMETSQRIDEASVQQMRLN
ncbi:MAG: flagellar basal body rod protein FlgF [Gammaproteobacteria bacterium]|nr:flagellar basal body rod protein FlgF [Gammaproteobacteria bacterium]